MTVEFLINEVFDKSDFMDLSDIKFFVGTFGNDFRFYSDSILPVDTTVENVKDFKILNYCVMSEKDYNETILANCHIKADFAVLYGDKDAKVLVILLKI